MLERRYLGREGNFVVPKLGVVERLFAWQIACQQKLALNLDPQRCRKHAIQALEQVFAVVRVKMTDDLAVAIGPEAMPLPLELTPQLGIVVDLAVVDQHDLAALAIERLVAVGEVNDGETPHADRVRAVPEVTVGVRTAMHQRAYHAAQHVFANELMRQEPCDATHQANENSQRGIAAP